MITEREAKRILLSSHSIDVKAYLIHLHSKDEEKIFHECGVNCSSHHMGLGVYFCPKCKVEF